jgi:glyoxylase-like metal-dependent hydrolase (beta-lactamase superfamily II)
VTDYADIKRRLRELDTYDERASFTPCPVGQAGADAIEALEKERDRYRDTLVARHGGEPIALLEELDEARARVAELEKERDEARAVARRATDEWAVHARVAELEGLIRSRCEQSCYTVLQSARPPRHAPECLVEEAWIQ